MKLQEVYSAQDFEKLSDNEKSILLNVLKENMGYVSENEWTQFYKSRSYWQADLFITTILTMMIYDLGVDPLEYMDSVPGFFLARADITDFVIPHGVKKIESSAFGGCEKLKTITIPTTMEEIQALSFEQCGNLNKIIYKGTKQMWSKINTWSAWSEDMGNFTIECTDGSYTKIKEQ